MTIVARRFAASPARTAGEVWNEIVKLISAEASDARKELYAVSGVISTLIADECPNEVPIVVAGNGPRLRIYCVYGEDAVLEEDCDETPLSWLPTENDWNMHCPCKTEDLDWVKKQLDRLSRRVFAYDLSDLNKSFAQTVEGEVSTFDLSVNVEGFKRR